jgi:hypothetical protein
MRFTGWVHFGNLAKSRRRTGIVKKITSQNYKKEKLYSSVVRAVEELLQAGPVVTPIDLLLKTERVTKQQVEDWRFGRIAYLERVCLGNLSKLSRLLRILDLHARAIGLTPSQTVYRKWGKGGKRITLVFTKGRDPNMEAAYSRHYVAKGSGKNPEQSSASKN